MHFLISLGLLFILGLIGLAINNREDLGIVIIMTIIFMFLIYFK